MTQRQQRKEASLQRILDAGAIRLRAEGMMGAGIVPVMGDAGLTAGAFYSHFTNKDELVIASLRHALASNRSWWIGRPQKETWPERLRRLAHRYLTGKHRDTLSDSCAFSALASEAARANGAFRQAYEDEFYKSLNAICDVPAGDSAEASRVDSAIALMALCVGGVTFARSVADGKFSDRILAACRHAASRLEPSGALAEGHDFPPPRGDETACTRDQFPLKSSEKLRYDEISRDGYVGNSAVVSLLEASRAEILEVQSGAFIAENSCFVTAELALNLRSEPARPGRVDIGSQICEVQRRSLRIEQGLFQDERCIATASALVVQINKTTGSPQVLTEAAAAYFSGLLPTSSSPCSMR